MTDIVEFLRARYAEERALAAAAAAGAGDPTWRASDGFVLGDRGVVATGAQEELELPVAQYIASRDPGSSIADIDAKLRIVDLYAEHADYDTPDEPYEYATGRIVGLGVALRLLAVQFAEHQDYREEWRP